MYVYVFIKVCARAWSNVIMNMKKRIVKKKIQTEKNEQKPPIVNNNMLLPRPTPTAGG